jgi:hypothetical protein
MPRYYFTLDDHEREVDEDGTELASPDEAKTQAVRFASAWLRDHPDRIWEGANLKVEVSDESGTLLFTVFAKGIDGDASQED